MYSNNSNKTHNLTNKSSSVIEPNNNVHLQSLEPATTSASSSVIIQNNNKLEKQYSLQDLFDAKKFEIKPIFQRPRSNSDGALSALAVKDSAPFSRFSNNVLEKLGLYRNGIRKPVNQEAEEQKFTSLALACTIDATTIKDRCERQKRNRDQNESNFYLEIERLKEKLSLLTPLCINFETADLFSTIFSQVDILANAAALVSISAERYGAAQHEEKLTESVQLMVRHVQALKQQRDSALRQLQYTKRVLHEPVNAEHKILKNKILITKRRASTDSVNFNFSYYNNNSDPNKFKINRRTSELGLARGQLLSKSRSNRFELGKELNKIKEMPSYNEPKNNNEFASVSPELEKLEIPSFDIPNKDEYDSDLESNNTDFKNKPNSLKYDEYFIITELSSMIRLKFSSYCEDIQRRFIELFNKWSKNGYLHAFLNSCAIICFSISILTLTRIFLAEENTRWLFPWFTSK